MSKITAVSAQAKNKERVNIYLDGEFAAGVSLETVMSLRLKVGDEIDEEKLKSLLELSERTDAANKAVKYISGALKTKKQVKDYLLKKGFSEETVWYTIDKLKDYGYINDAEFSEKFIESTRSKQGRRLAEYKLMMKGVKKEVIDSVYAESEISQKEDAARLAEKYLRNKEITRENISKAYRYLIGRGFSFDEADFALSGFKSED